jgi:hypothetical protein
MKTENPPAFPRTGYYPDVDRNDGLEAWRERAHTVTESQHGMTLRDYFAAKSLPSLVTEGLRLDHESWAATAQHAYIIADAMLTERSK